MDNISSLAVKHTASIYQQASSVIKIKSLGGKRWKRKVAKGSRVGPWLQAEYEIVDNIAWKTNEPCLYLVAGDDKNIRYVGISRNGLKHRWRTSPAYDALTMVRLPKNQLFHSQCWKNIELESKSNPNATFEVRSITASALIPLLKQIGEPISALSVLKDDGESIVASVERWICNYSNTNLACWNISMTGKK